MNVDELLVATFTNASAAEMRQRIGVAIEKELPPIQIPLIYENN